MHLWILEDHLAKRTTWVLTYTIFNKLGDIVTEEVTEVRYYRNCLLRLEICDVKEE